MKSTLIDRQGHQWITEQVKIRKLLNQVPEVITASISTHLTDDMTFHEIDIKSEQLKAANSGANAEQTNLVYPSKGLSYTNASSPSFSCTTQQPRPDKGLPH